jgi:hypothetical protein
MNYPTPITQRAKANYKAAPANQEVTVDAAGTTPSTYFNNEKGCGCGCGD